MTGCIVIMENPILRATDPVAFAKCSSSNAAELCSKILCWQSGPGDEVTMNNATVVKKHDEHGLRWSVAHSRLLRSWRWWAHPLRRLQLCLRFVPIDPRLVTGDDPGHEGLIICGMLTEILAHCDAMFLRLGSAVGGQTWQRHAAFSIPTLGLSALTHMAHQQY
jgi:hypothetical protein